MVQACDATGGIERGGAPLLGPVTIGAGLAHPPILGPFLPPAPPPGLPGAAASHRHRTRIPGRTAPAA
ncbi:MAG: hypothetical protein ACU0CO_11160 [Shimia sp.]